MRFIENILRLFASKKTQAEETNPTEPIRSKATLPIDELTETEKLYCREAELNNDDALFSSGSTAKAQHRILKNGEAAMLCIV